MNNTSTATKRNELLQRAERLKEERDKNRKTILISLLDLIKEKNEIESTADLSLFLLGRGLNIRSNHLSNYYYRRNIPTMDTFLQLCQIAGYSLEKAGRLGWGDVSALEGSKSSQLSENDLVASFMSLRKGMSLWAVRTLLNMLLEEVITRATQKEETYLPESSGASN